MMSLKDLQSQMIKADRTARTMKEIAGILSAPPWPRPLRLQLA